MAKKLTKKQCYEIMKNDYTLFYHPMPESWKDLFPVITVNELEKFGLKATTKHNGKMTGMFSYSGTCKACKSCQDKIKIAFEKLGIDLSDVKKARATVKEYIKNNPLSMDVIICAFCFSDSQQDVFTNMSDPLIRNYHIFNDGIIHDNWIPVLNNLYFRWEAFGDFASVNAVINAYKFAEKNPLVNLTPWTKNLVWFYMADKAGYKKPGNLKLIYSSSYINKPGNVPEKCKHLVDKRFTVYTPKFAEKNNIAINCGARACLSCLKCYTQNNIFDIAELLK